MKICFYFSRPSVFFVLGRPGSGKGTQCEYLAKQYQFIHLSAGELLRIERASGSKDGDLIESCIVSGQIVPSHITVTLLKKEIQKNGLDKKYLIDGFPRNLENMNSWDDKMSQFVDGKGVINIQCEEQDIIDRIMKRSQQTQRSDDNMNTLKKRLKTFNEETQKVIEKYRSQNKEIQVNGSQAKEKVFYDLITELQKRNFI